MEAIVPWVALCAVIEPHYPKAGNGRPPIGLERMLRIHFIQHGFNLADLCCEEALFAQVGAALQSKAKQRLQSQHRHHRGWRPHWRTQRHQERRQSA
jgi:hypothetical protein